MTPPIESLADLAAALRREAEALDKRAESLEYGASVCSSDGALERIEARVKRDAAERIEKAVASAVAKVRAHDVFTDATDPGRTGWEHGYTDAKNAFADMLEGK